MTPPSRAKSPSRCALSLANKSAALGVTATLFCGFVARAAIEGIPEELPVFRLYDECAAAEAVTVHFLGATSILFRDAETAILSDGFISRPGFFRVLLGRVSPDTSLIQAALDNLGVDSIAAIFTGHSHYDHALDSPEIARRTGAVLLGSASTMQIGRGSSIPESQLRTVHHGDSLRFGRFSVTFIESRHSPGDLHPGTVETPITPPARTGQYKSGPTWSILIEHDKRVILLHGSANYVPDALRGKRADVVYLGIGGLGRQSIEFVNHYWDEVVKATGAKRLILVHWDNFFRKLDEPLRPMPFLLDDVSAAMRRIQQRANAEGVEVFLPASWIPVHPFLGAPLARHGTPVVAPGCTGG